MKLFPISLKAVLFDVDGTFLDSEKAIISIYQESFRNLRETFSLSFPLPTDAQISSLIGAPRRSAFKALTSLSPDSQYYEFFWAFNTPLFLEKLQRKEIPLMPQTLEVFHFLLSKGLKVGLASNASVPYLKMLLQVYDLPINLPLITLDKEHREKKDILASYIQTTSLETEEMLMVGDRIYDIEAAEGNHIPSIILKSGIGYKVNPQEVQGATLLLADMGNLLSWTQNHLPH